MLVGTPAFQLSGLSSTRRMSLAISLAAGSSISVTYAAGMNGGNSRASLEPPAARTESRPLALRTPAVAGGKGRGANDAINRPTITLQ